MVLKINKICQILMSASVLGIVFFTPLFFSFLPFTDSVFLVPKWALFKLLVLAGAAAWLGYELTRSKQADKRGVIWFAWPAGGIILGFLAVNVFFSIDPWLSFEGNLARLTGLRTVFLLLAWFGLVTAYLRLDYERHLRRMALAAALAGSLAGFYAILQSEGLDPLPWSESVAWRAHSTFGQPNELAGWLIMSIALTVLAVFLSGRQSKEPDSGGFWRNFLQISRSGPSVRQRPPFLSARLLFFYGLLALQLAGLFLSYSFSAWLGLAAGLLMAFLMAAAYGYGVKILDFGRGHSREAHESGGKEAGGIYRFACRILNRFKAGQEEDQEKKKVFIRNIAGIMLVLSVLAGWLVWQDRTFQARFHSFFSADTGTGSVRLTLWQAGWQAVLARPWLGYGLETQFEAILPYYSPDWAATIGPDALAYRAHNLALDTLLSQGVLGLFFWLAMLYWLVRAAWRPADGAWEQICLWPALLALLVFLQFQYWHLVLLVYVIMIIAVLLVRTSESGAFSVALPPLFRKAQNSPIIRRSSALALILSVLIIGGQEARHALAQVKADHYFWEFRNAIHRNAVFAAADMQSFLYHEQPGRHHYLTPMSATWTKRAADLPAREFYPPILDNFSLPDRSVSSHNYRMYVLNYLILQEFLTEEDNNGQIISGLESLKAINPERLEPYLMAARYHIIRAEKEDARRELSLARQKLLPLDDPRLNIQHLFLLQNNFDYIESLEELAEEAD